MANHTVTHEPRTLDDWIGLTAYGSAGEEIGQISDIYLDDETNRPQWLIIEAGLFGKNRHFAPIEGVEYRSGYIRISSTKDQVKDAPSLEADVEGPDVDVETPDADIELPDVDVDVDPGSVDSEGDFNVEIDDADAEADASD